MKGISTSVCSILAANTPQANARTPYCPANSAAARIIAKLSGKPVIWAAMYFSWALRRLAREMEVMLNISVKTMMRTISTVSAAFQGS